MSFDENLWSITAPEKSVPRKVRSRLDGQVFKDLTSKVTNGTDFMDLVGRAKKAEIRHTPLIDRKQMFSLSSIEIEENVVDDSEEEPELLAPVVPKIREVSKVSQTSSHSQETKYTESDQERKFKELRAQESESESESSDSESSDSENDESEDENTKTKETRTVSPKRTKPSEERGPNNSGSDESESSEEESESSENDSDIEIIDEVKKDKIEPVVTPKVQKDSESKTDAELESDDSESESESDHEPDAEVHPKAEQSQAEQSQADSESSSESEAEVVELEKHDLTSVNHSTEVKPSATTQNDSTQTPQLQSSDSKSQEPLRVTTRPLKRSLKDICNQTNRAKLRGRVGLSRRVNIESLHGYLNS